MAGAKVWIPNIVINLTDTERQLFETELRLIDRPGAPYDAATIADALSKPRRTPIEIDETPHQHAAIRALDNLRWAHELAGHTNLLRLRDALTWRGIVYEVRVTGIGERLDFISWSGPFEPGDRLRLDAHELAVV